MSASMEINKSTILQWAKDEVGLDHNVHLSVDLAVDRFLQATFPDASISKVDKNRDVKFGSYLANYKDGSSLWINFREQFKFPLSRVIKFEVSSGSLEKIKTLADSLSRLA